MLRINYIFLALAVLSTQAWSEQLKLISKQRTFFAGQKFEVQFQGRANEAVSYRLKYANRTIKAGQFNFDKGGHKKLELAFPKLNPYVVAQAELILKSSQEEISKTVYFFSEQGYSKNDQEIAVFSENKELKNALERFGANVVSVDGLNRVEQESLIVVGMDFDKFSGIEDSLKALCQRKRKVIFIDSIGTLNWPSDIQEFKLYNEHFPKQLDKRFDSHFSQGGFMASERDGKPALKIISGVKALSFCQMKVGHGEITILGNGFLKDIKTNPSVLFSIKSLIGGK